MFDALEMLSDNQDLAQVVGNYLSDKSIDLWGGAQRTTINGNSPVNDLGRGNELQIVVQVTEAFTGANGTVLVELVQADNEALTSNLQSLTQAPGGSITVGVAVALLVVGYKWRLAIPRGGVSKRYLGLRYNIFTTNMTTGKVSAFLAKDVASAPGTFS